MADGCLRIPPSNDLFSTLSSQRPKMATSPALKVSSRRTMSQPLTAADGWRLLVLLAAQFRSTVRLHSVRVSPHEAGPDCHDIVVDLN
jgi:hypothetical protein